MDGTAVALRGARVPQAEAELVTADAAVLKYRQTMSKGFIMYEGLKTG